MTHIASIVWTAVATGRGKMIIHQIDTQGGFTVGDTVTGHTAYAYPSSEHATKALRSASKVAAEMVKQANEINPQLPRDLVERANARNWMNLPTLTREG